MNLASNRFEWVEKCMEDECKNKSIMICKDHGLIVCACCLGGLHATCQTVEIGNVEVVKKVEEIVESIIKRMTIYGFTYKLNKRYSGFDEDLKAHVADLRDFKNTFDKAEKEKDAFQMQTLQEKILTLKAKIDRSYCFISFSTFLVNRHETLKSRGSDELMLEGENFKDMLNKATERLRKEIEKDNKKKIRLNKLRIIHKLYIIRII